MKQTEAYQFNLPEGSDVCSAEPLNENMRRLDALLKNLEAVLSLTGLSVADAAAGRRLGGLEAGSLVKLNENGVPKVYILLEHNHYGQGEATLLRKDTLGPRAFRSCGGNADASTCASNAFAGSDYDTFHSVLHVQSLDPIVRACLVNVPVPCCRGWIGTAFDAAIDTLSRACFPLSRSEVGLTLLKFKHDTQSRPSGAAVYPEEGTLFARFAADADRIAYCDGTGTAVCWGNRTPFLNSQNGVSSVTEKGGWRGQWASGTTTSVATAVTAAPLLCPRPALTLSPELLVTREPDGDGCYGVVGLPEFALCAGAAV